MLEEQFNCPPRELTYRPLRILVVNRPGSQLKGYGVERYAEEFVATLLSSGIDAISMGKWRIAQALSTMFPSYGPVVSTFVYEIVLPLLFLISNVSRRPQIVHFVDVSYAFPSILLARLLGYKVVVSMQSLNGISYLMLAPGGGSVRDALYVAQRQFAFRVALHYADVLLAMSELEEGEVRKRYPGVTVRTVHPTTRYIDTPPAGHETGTLNLGFVGALMPQKRVEKGIRVLALVMQKRPDARFIIRGDGRSLKELESFAERTGISSNVEFVGHVDGGLQGLYGGLDFLVFPSLRESFGFPIVEAAACGVLCLTFSDSRISPEVSELSVVVEDERQASELILRLSETQTEYADVARQMKLKTGRFSRASAGRKLLEVYSQVLRGSV